MRQLSVQIRSIHPDQEQPHPPLQVVLLGAVAERRMHFAVDEDDDGSSPFGPANHVRTDCVSGQPFHVRTACISGRPVQQGENTYVRTQESHLYRDVNSQLFLVR